MTGNPKLQELLARADKDALLTALLEGRTNEEIAKAAGLRSKSEDPPTPETPTNITNTATAELTDAEADKIADKVWLRIAERLDAKTNEQQTATAEAATKAQEPIQAEITKLKASVDGLTSVFKSLLGEQPGAHQHYRASNDPANVIDKAGDEQPQLSYSERLAAQQEQRLKGAS